MAVFVALGLAGFLLVAGAFLFGHDHDHDFSHDVDHSHDLSHGEAGRQPSIGIFSTKILATFVMGFGAAGAIARHIQYDYLWSSGVGVAAGVCLGFIMWALMNFIVQQQASSVTDVRDLVGADAAVTVAIEPGSLGEIGLQTEMGYANFPARSRTCLEKGQRVRVTDASTNVLTVEPLEPA